MNKTTLAITLLAAMAMTGCARVMQQSMPVGTPVSPPTGVIYSEYSAPLTVDFDNTPVPAKTGKATVEYIRFPFYYDLSISWGDASVDAAKVAGNLKNVEFCDYEYMTVLGIYSRYTTCAHGE